MKRFWDFATAELVSEAALYALPGFISGGRAPAPEGYAILLDGKPMHVPGGGRLVVRGAALARAIAAEWQQAGGQKGGTMTLEDVPLTRLAGTAQERIAPNPAPVVDALARYAETDALCYRADHPPALVLRQARDWQPWLDWLEAAHGARLHPTEGVMHVQQDPAAVEAVRRAISAEPPTVLAALGLAVPALGSIALGLALADGVLDAVRAHELASLDELFQAEQWGEDAEAVRRRAGVAADIALAARCIALARAP